ncbi:hypothetical protein SUDANB106_01691 [Streptomyces sp. enrichment culture]
MPLLVLRADAGLEVDRRARERVHDISLGSVCGGRARPACRSDPRPLPALHAEARAGLPHWPASATPAPTRAFTPRSVRTPTSLYHSRRIPAPTTGCCAASARSTNELLPSSNSTGAPYGTRRPVPAGSEPSPRPDRRNLSKWPLVIPLPLPHLTEQKLAGILPEFFPVFRITQQVVGNSSTYHLTDGGPPTSQEVLQKLSTSMCDILVQRKGCGQERRENSLDEDFAGERISSDFHRVATTREGVLPLLFLQGEDFQSLFRKELPKKSSHQRRVRGTRAP